VPKFLLSAVEQAMVEKNSNNPDFEKMKSAVTNFKISGGKIELQLNPEVVNDLKQQAENAKDAREIGEQGLTTREMEIYKYVLDRIESHTNAGKSAEESEKAAIADAATKFAITEDEAAMAYRKAKKVSER
jgi:hypothetical protein